MKTTTPHQHYRTGLFLTLTMIGLLLGQQAALAQETEGLTLSLRRNFG
jgi:hypothetical protein